MASARRASCALRAIGCRRTAFDRARAPLGEFGLNQAFKRAQKRAGKSGWTVHRLRHFFVTELFRNGVSAAVVQRLARHGDLGTTQRYADLDANDLREAIASAAPNA